MGKRKQPFGYKMKLGEIVPQPQEAETVRSIYLQYLAGVSFKQLAEQLQTEDVPYDEDKSWNKNMVARILEDDRYIGEKEFPALIPTEQFHAAQERRKEMCPEYKQTPAQKELRKLCGGTVPDSVARKVLKILNQMVDDPRCSHHRRYPAAPAGTEHAATDTTCRCGHRAAKSLGGRIPKAGECQNGGI